MAAVLLLPSNQVNSSGLALLYFRFRGSDRRRRLCTPVSVATGLLDKWPRSVRPLLGLKIPLSPFPRRGGGRNEPRKLAAGSPYLDREVPRDPTFLLLIGHSHFCCSRLRKPNGEVFAAASTARRSASRLFLVSPCSREHDDGHRMSHFARLLYALFFFVFSRSSQLPLTSRVAGLEPDRLRREKLRFIRDGLTDPSMRWSLASKLLGSRRRRATAACELV